MRLVNPEWIFLSAALLFSGCPDEPARIHDGRCDLVRRQPTRLRAIALEGGADSKSVTLRELGACSSVRCLWRSTGVFVQRHGDELKLSLSAWPERDATVPYEADPIVGKDAIATFEGGELVIRDARAKQILRLVPPPIGPDARWKGLARLSGRLVLVSARAGQQDQFVVEQPGAPAISSAPGELLLGSKDEVHAVVRRSGDRISTRWLGADEPWTEVKTRGTFQGGNANPTRISIMVRRPNGTHARVSVTRAGQRAIDLGLQAFASTPVGPVVFAAWGGISRVGATSLEPWLGQRGRPLAGGVFPPRGRRTQLRLAASHDAAWFLEEVQRDDCSIFTRVYQPEGEGVRLLRELEGMVMLPSGHEHTLLGVWADVSLSPMPQ